MENKSMLSQILQTKLPETLYHYTSAKGLMGIIESKKIWTTKIHYLNDKSELQLAFDLISDEIHQQIKGKGFEKGHTDEELYQMLGQIISIQAFNISVASFTKIGDQLSQWRGYCDVGNGYSLGFDGTRLLAACRRGEHFYDKESILSVNWPLLEANAA